MTTIHEMAEEAREMVDKQLVPSDDIAATEAAHEAGFAEAIESELEIWRAEYGISPDALTALQVILGRYRVL